MGGTIEAAPSSDEKPRLNGMVEVTRSFGNFSELGNTVEPAIFRTRLTAEDTFLVIATDGLWDVMQPAEAVRTLSQVMLQMGTVRFDVHRLQTATDARINQVMPP